MIPLTFTTWARSKLNSPLLHCASRTVTGIFYAHKTKNSLILGGKNIMEFISQAVTVLQTLVIALGAGLGS